MEPGDDLRHFTWKLAIVLGAAALVWLVAAAAHVLLLVFTGVLLAILLRRLAGLLARATRLPEGGALAVVLLLILGAIGGGSLLLGSSAMTQMGQLQSALVGAWQALPENFRAQIGDSAQVNAVLAQLGAYAPSVLFGLADLLVVLFSALYLAAQPAPYRRGLLLLVPPRGRERTEEILTVLDDALWLWMIGQLVNMAIVGTVTGLGLWLIGIPVAVQLGVIAGLLEFVPYLGPILSAIPAILIGFAQSPTDALWVAGLFLIVQQVEGNLVQPLVQRSVVELPPVVTIAAVTVGGYLFGIVGLLVATPLVIVVMTLVNMLWLQDELGEERRFPDQQRVPEPPPGKAAVDLAKDGTPAG